MRLLDLRQFESFQGQRTVKVVRHHDKNQDLMKLHASNQFTQYQNLQSRDVFKGAEYLISFVGQRHKYAIYLGVWKVMSTKKRPDGGFLYRTKKMPGFDELCERLVIEWGEGARSWAQWLHKQGNKIINEILPPDYVMELPGFYDFTLSFQDLEKMISNPDSNREWQRMLSSVSGVYLILDEKSGQQYIGSAYGREGIWARWRSYARNPSGGNLQLKKLLSRNLNRHKQFQFSVLRVLEPSATKNEVIAQESLLKKKLGSRAFGLNSN